MAQGSRLLCERASETRGCKWMAGKGSERKFERGRAQVFMRWSKAAKAHAKARCLIGGAPNPARQIPTK